MCRRLWPWTEICFGANGGVGLCDQAGNLEDISSNKTIHEASIYGVTQSPKMKVHKQKKVKITYLSDKYKLARNTKLKSPLCYKYLMWSLCIQIGSRQRELNILILISTSLDLDALLNTTRVRLITCFLIPFECSPIYAFIETNRLDLLLQFSYVKPFDLCFTSQVISHTKKTTVEKSWFPESCHRLPRNYTESHTDM